MKQEMQEKEGKKLPKNSPKEKPILKVVAPIKEVKKLPDKDEKLSPVPASKEVELSEEEQKILDEKIKLQLRNVALKFIRIRDDYFKIVFRPDKTGKHYKDLLRLLKSTIIDDYTKSILKYIQKYDDFTIVPSHIDFKQEINGFYNQYYELTHQPIEGEFDTIKQIILHVFGRDYFDFALDYCQLLYLFPNQRLPILLFESFAKNTGKSTIGTLFYLIFQDNAIKIGNSDLSSDFNGVWLQRLLIIIDEASLEKQGVMQMLKRLSTETGKVIVNEKNKAQREVDFIGKFLFFSNDEGKALPIERGDPRWAVFKVPTFLESGLKDDPHIEAKMVTEIPAFLHFLKNRQMVYENKSRMYFSPSVYLTPQVQIYYENSISKLAYAIKQMIMDTFAMYEEETELKFSVANITDELKEYMRFVDKGKVKYALEIEFGILPNKKNTYRYFSLKCSENDKHYYPDLNSGGNNVTYSFFRKYFGE